MDIRIMVAAAAGALLGAWAHAAEIKTVEPAEGAVVPLLTDAQKAYLDLPYEQRRVKFADQKFRDREMGYPAEQIPGEEKKREVFWPRTVRLA